MARSELCLIVTVTYIKTDINMLYANDMTYERNENNKKKMKHQPTDFVRDFNI